jgi:chromosome segregation ATPase
MILDICNYVMDVQFLNLIIAPYRTGTQLHDQKNISQTIISLTKRERAVAGMIHEKEIEIANIQNELARLQIDSLNTEAHTSRLSGRLNEETTKLDANDHSITKLETEIRRRHNDIEGKMNKVDRLNRKYEQMLDGAEDEEHLGPLENTIKRLQKSINEIENDIQTQQKEWMENQTTLIKTIDETETLESSRRQILATLNILKQKRLRLIQNIHTNDVTLKIIQSRIKGMHTDMSRLNEMIGKNTRHGMELANDNSVKEMEFTHELKELEQESNQMEKKITKVKNEKEQILIDILDVEKQILFWEKKIHLEKEIQATLNSSEDAHETKGMEKEIHRMKHRLDCMKRDQEKMLREMELAIHKKEDIAVKYQYAKHGDTNTSKSKKTTVAELKKRKTILMKQRKEIEMEKRKVSFR